MRPQQPECQRIRIYENSEIEMVMNVYCGLRKLETSTFEFKAVGILLRFFLNWARQNHFDAWKMKFLTKKANSFEIG